MIDDRVAALGWDAISAALDAGGYATTPLLTAEECASLVALYPLRAVIQRVSEAAVAIAGRPRGRIGPGLLVLLGVGDTGTDADYVARKVAEVRISRTTRGR